VSLHNSTGAASVSYAPGTWVTPESFRPTLSRRRLLPSVAAPLTLPSGPSFLAGSAQVNKWGLDGATYLNHSYFMSPEPSTWQRSSISLPTRIADGSFGCCNCTLASLTPATEKSRDQRRWPCNLVVHASNASFVIGRHNIDSVYL